MYKILLAAIISITGFGIAYTAPQAVRTFGLAVYVPSQGGTGTSSVPVAGDLLMSWANGSYGPTKLIAGTNVTISTSTYPQITISSTASGSGGTGNVATSTTETAGQLSYWTSSGATPATLGTIATTTLTASSPLSLSNPVVKVGGSNSVLTLDTSGTWSGNAGTATALAANGTNCSAGSYALGVDASGNAESCTDATTEIDSAITTHASNATAHQALVTLAGALDYLTISGQEITRAAIDLTTDVTGTLPYSNGGTGTSTPAIWGDVLYWNGSNWQGKATSTLGISGGDVTKVGTPLDNQVGVWTGDGTIEGDTGLTFNGTNKNLTLTGTNAAYNIDDGAGSSYTMDPFQVYQSNVDGSAFGNVVQAGSTYFYIIDTGAGAFGPYWSFHHNSASPAANDTVFTLYMAGENSASAQRNYGLIQTKIVDPTTSSEDGKIVFNTFVAGSADDRLTVGDQINGIKVGASTAAGIVSSNGAQDLTLQTGNSTTGTITITDGANGNIALTPNGTGTTTTTRLDITTGISILGEYFQNFTTYVRSLFTASTGISIASGAISVDQTFSPTWTGAHDFGGATSVEIPNGTAPTTDATGELSWDTTSGQMKIFDGSANRVLSDGYLYPAFTYATSTAWTGTTTIPLGPSFVAETWSSVMCFTDTGTLEVQFTDGTNNMNRFNASTTVGTVTLSTNNTFTAAEKRYVNIGTPASSPTKVSCTLRKSITAD